MGLPKAQRLRHWRDFRTVYRQGIRQRSQHLTLVALLRTLGRGKSEFDQLAPTRFGISISQKVSKKAVVRNQLKRRIRGVIRELTPEIVPGWQVVIIVRPEATKCEYEHFLRELRQLLIKTKIITYGH